MNEAPDDILRLLFETYVHDFKSSPAILLRVNRRWNALLLSTRNIWTAINIRINSFDIIPHIAGSTIGDDKSGDNLHQISPLQSYLDRSSSSNGIYQLPLDIHISWHTHSHYESPPSSVTRPDIIRAPPNHYGRDHEPYFTELDKRVCWLQLRLLLLSLAGVHVTLPPFRAREDTWTGFKRFNPGEEEQRKEVYFKRLENSFNEIIDYAACGLSATGFSSKYCTVTIGRNDALRWRSLNFDLYQVAGDGDIYIPMDLLASLERSHLTSLENLTLQSVYISMIRVTTPSLRTLRIRQSTFKSFPDLSNLEVLKISEGSLNANKMFLPWERLGRLRILKLLEPVSLNTSGWQRMMEKLESLFDRSHPLASISLCPKHMAELLVLFDHVPRFHVMTLNISAQYLKDRPRGELQESQPVFRPVTVEVTREVLKEMERRKTQVCGLDSMMTHLLHMASTEEATT